MNRSLKILTGVLERSGLIAVGRKPECCLSLGQVLIRNPVHQFETSSGKKSSLHEFSWTPLM